MDQGQVDVVGAQLVQAFAQARHKLAGGVVRRPDLGGHKQFIALHAGLGDSLADVGLVAVDLCRIDGAIAQVQRVAHRIDHGLAGQAESPDTK
ncbi:hypothetical protein D3C87_1850860 [compost metagenome]